MTNSVLCPTSSSTHYGAWNSYRFAISEAWQHRSWNASNSARESESRLLIKFRHPDLIVGAVCDRASFLPELHDSAGGKRAVTDRAYSWDHPEFDDISASQQMGQGLRYRWPFSLCWPILRLSVLR